MARFVLRYSGAVAPEEHTNLIAASPQVRVVDRSPKMMLIDADEGDANLLASQLPGWTLHTEVQYQLPDTRQKIVDG